MASCGYGGNLDSGYGQQNLGGGLDQGLGQGNLGGGLDQGLDMGGNLGSGLNQGLDMGGNLGGGLAPAMPNPMPGGGDDDCEDCVKVVKTMKTVAVPCHRNTYRQYTVKVPRQVTEQVPRTVKWTDYEKRTKCVPYKDFKTENRVKFVNQKITVPDVKQVTKMVSVTRKVPKTIYVDLCTQEPRTETVHGTKTIHKTIKIPYQAQVPFTNFKNVDYQVPVQKSKVVIDKVQKTVFDTQYRTKCEPKMTIVKKRIPVYNVIAKPPAPCPPEQDMGGGGGLAMAGASGGMMAASASGGMMAAGAQGGMMAASGAHGSMMAAGAQGGMMAAGAQGGMMAAGGQQGMMAASGAQAMAAGGMQMSNMQGGMQMQDGALGMGYGNSGGLLEQGSMQQGSMQQGSMQLPAPPMPSGGGYGQSSGY